MISRRSVAVGVIAMLAFLSAKANADETAVAGQLQVTSAWARATIRAGGNAVVYLTITNSGKNGDRLEALDSPVAEATRIHHTVVEDGVLRLRLLDALELEPGTTTLLEPGGAHIMLMQLFRPLVKGGTFPLVLHFEKAGTVTVTVDVGAESQMEPPE